MSTTCSSSSLKSSTRPCSAGLLARDKWPKDSAMISNRHAEKGRRRGMIYRKSKGGPVCCEMCLAEDTVFLSKGRELVYHRHYATREDATQDIFEYNCGVL